MRAGSSDHKLCFMEWFSSASAWLLQIMEAYLPHWEKSSVEKDVSREEASLVKNMLWPVWYSLSWQNLCCQQGWGSGGCTAQLGFTQCEPGKAVTLIRLCTHWKVSSELQTFPPIQLDVSPFECFLSLLKEKAACSKWVKMVNELGWQAGFGLLAILGPPLV